MSAIVRIKSIKRQHMLSDVEFLYILNHLNEDLQLMSLEFFENGTIWLFAIYTDEMPCITLFVDANEIDMEVYINGNRMY